MVSSRHYNNRRNDFGTHSAIPCNDALCRYRLTAALSVLTIAAFNSGGGRVIQGVAGITIWTDDLDGLTVFYRNTLELPVHSVRPTFVTFEWGPMRLNIGVHSDVKGQTTEPLRVMVNLSVEDIHRTYEVLVARGVDFIRPPEKEHWGGWVATFSDPDGNVLQLLQQPG